MKPGFVYPTRTMSETAHDAHVSFHTEAVPEGHLVVRSLRGREALGGDYAFELLLRPSEEEALDDADDDADGVPLATVQELDDEEIEEEGEDGEEEDDDECESEV